MKTNQQQWPTAVMQEWILRTYQDRRLTRGALALLTAALCSGALLANAPGTEAIFRRVCAIAFQDEDRLRGNELRRQARALVCLAAFHGAGQCAPPGWHPSHGN